MSTPATSPNRETGGMTHTELAERIMSALHRYTAETALQLEHTEALSIRIHPSDWNSIRRTVGITWLDPEGNRFMNIKVAVDDATEPGRPRLVSHWEFVL